MQDPLHRTMLHGAGASQSRFASSGTKKVLNQGGPMLIFAPPLSAS